MSTYEADPAGLGVGKRYGARGIGGVAGVYRGDGAEREYIWEFTAGEVLNGAASLSLILPAFYRVESIYYEVEEAFATDAEVNVSIDGGATLTTPIPLDAVAAITSAGLTGLANVTSTTNEPITVSGNTEAVESGTGKARIMVRFKAV